MAGYKILPLFQDSVFSYTIALANVRYKFVFYWNSRVERYHFDILSEGSDEVATGLALVVNVFDTIRWDEHGSYLVCIPLTENAKNDAVSQTAVASEYSLVFFDRS